ncbi:MAG: hypothetical protein WBF54_19355 [Terriglobales bacterium]
MAVLQVTVVAVLQVTVGDAPRAMVAATLQALAAAIRRRAVTEAADRRMEAGPTEAVDRMAVAAADMGGKIALEFFPA